MWEYRNAQYNFESQLLSRMFSCKSHAEKDKAFLTLALWIILLLMAQKPF